eukprot:TRINITY_DN10646_c0_g1_i2.p1 TRINITY_DN10646_c0_g1~~TRINITY_DN10646_c0_g1_i2.p1  ORF type:complete len:1034 (+),score=134.88 TRINITY_DN10646_c0_g1_i2:32-3133(+)
MSATEEERPDCVICLGEIDGPDECTLPCNHTYHKGCINEWGKNKELVSCPQCRNNVVPEIVQETQKPLRLLDFVLIPFMIVFLLVEQVPVVYKLIVRMLSRLGSAILYYTDYFPNYITYGATQIARLLSYCGEKIYLGSQLVGRATWNGMVVVYGKLAAIGRVLWNYINSASSAMMVHVRYAMHKIFNALVYLKNIIQRVMGFVFSRVWNGLTICFSWLSNVIKRTSMTLWKVCKYFYEKIAIVFRFIFNIFQILGRFIMNCLDWVWIKLNLIGNTIWRGITNFLIQTYNIFMNSAVWVMDKIVRFVSRVVEIIIEVDKWIWESFKMIVTSTWNITTSFIKWNWEKIKQIAIWMWALISFVVDKIIKFLTRVVEFIIEVDRRIWEWFKMVVTSAWNISTSFIKWNWDKLTICARWAWRQTCLVSRNTWNITVRFSRWSGNLIASFFKKVYNTLEMITRWVANQIIRFLRSVWNVLVVVSKWIWDKVTTSSKWTWNVISTFGRWSWDWTKYLANYAFATTSSWGRWTWNIVSRCGLWTWNLLSKIGKWVWETVVSFSRALWNLCVMWGKKTGDVISTVSRWTWNVTCNAAQKSWNAITTVGRKTWNVLTIVGSNTWNAVKYVGTKTSNALTMMARKTWNAITISSKYIWDKLELIGRWVWNVLSTIGRWVWNGLAFVGEFSWGIVYQVGFSVYSTIRSCWNIFVSTSKYIGNIVWSCLSWVASNVVYYGGLALRKIYNFLNWLFVGVIFRFFSYVFGKIFSFLRALFAWITNPKAFFQAFGRKILAFYLSLKEFFTPAFNFIKAILSPILESIRIATRYTTDFIKATYASIRHLTVTLFSPMINLLKQVMKASWESLKRTANYSKNVIVALVLAMKQSSLRSIERLTLWGGRLKLILLERGKLLQEHFSRNWIRLRVLSIATAQNVKKRWADLMVLFNQWRTRFGEARARWSQKMANRWAELMVSFNQWRMRFGETRARWSQKMAIRWQGIKLKMIQLRQRLQLRWNLLKLKMQHLRQDTEQRWRQLRAKRNNN